MERAAGHAEGHPGGNDEIAFGNWPDSPAVQLLIKNQGSLWTNLDLLSIHATMEIREQSTCGR